MANVFESDWDVEIPEPWSLRFARVGHQAGSERLGATVYEVEPGGVVSPLESHLHRRHALGRGPARFRRGGDTGAVRADGGTSATAAIASPT